MFELKLIVVLKCVWKFADFIATVLHTHTHTRTSGMDTQSCTEAKWEI